MPTIKIEQLKNKGEPFYPLVADSSFSGVLSAAKGGIGTPTEYTNHENGSLTTLLNKTKTFTISGAGLLFISGSIVTQAGTWGTQKVEISKNGTRIAFGSDTITARYDNFSFGANAAAFVLVQAGDVITINYYSTRYTSGNTYDAYYNVMAIGCTATIS